MSKFELKNNELFDLQTKILNDLSNAIVKNGTEVEKYLKVIADQFVLLNQKSDVLIEEIKSMKGTAQNSRQAIKKE